MSKSAWIVLVLMAAFIGVLFIPACGEQDPGNEATLTHHKVDALVREQLLEGEQTNFWIDLHTRADLTEAFRIADWEARGWFVYDTLTETARASQSKLRRLLDERGDRYLAFWIKSCIYVQGGDRNLLAKLVQRSEIARIRPDEALTLPEPWPARKLDAVNGVEWGVDRVRAPEVWSSYGVRGEGIVVANIDTGVDFDHPALASQYRGLQAAGGYDHNYNWYDPSGMYVSTPTDTHDHGTHTMGTMVGDDGGDNRIGVAPAARWIAAKGCGSAYCPGHALLSAGQWIVAPTDLNNQNPRPDLRPHLVNNSWGGRSGETWYQEVVDAWEAAGIFPAFAVGNSGPSCGLAGSPGDYPNSYASGAFNEHNEIASFSSRGPSYFNEGKPDIASPGVSVRSSIDGGTYNTFSGTSMASPHTAGAVALMWSAAPSLVGDVAATRAILDQSAVDMDDTSCGGTAGENNIWGQGRLDAMAAVVNSPVGPRGALEGRVIATNTGKPIQGARIVILGKGDRDLVTNTSGFYSIGLPVGSYDMTVSAFGYLTQSLTDIPVLEDQTTNRNLALAGAPQYPVSGRVLDGDGKGVGQVTVTLLSTPIAASVTEADGNFAFPDVPEGQYQIEASPQAFGCVVSLNRELVVDGPQSLNLVLPNKTDEMGYTCRLLEPSYLEAAIILPVTGDEHNEFIYRQDLPFHFPYYGEVFDVAFISIHGNLNFGQTRSHPYNKKIPSLQLPNVAIFPFWDYLTLDDEASLRVKTLGVAPDRRFVIEWRNILIEDSGDLRLDFQVILLESGDIQFQYRNVGTDALEQGSSASIGIEHRGTVGLQYSFNQAALIDSSHAIHFNMPSGINHPPIAHAGADQQVREGSLVALDASASFDVDGDALSYSWTSRQGVTLSDPTAAKPSFEAPEVDSKRSILFSVKVHDGELESSVAAVKVIVYDRAANMEPVAVASEDQIVEEGSMVQLDGSASYDLDGDSLTYSWVPSPGVEVVLSDAQAARPTFQAPEVDGAETLTFSLRVRDGQLPSKLDYVNVLIQDVPGFPCKTCKKSR